VRNHSAEVGVDADPPKTGLWEGRRPRRPLVTGKTIVPYFLGVRLLAAAFPIRRLVGGIEDRFQILDGTGVPACGRDDGSQAGTPVLPDQDQA